MNNIELSTIIAVDIFAEIPINCDKSEIGDVLDEMKTIIYSHLTKSTQINEEEPSINYTTSEIVHNILRDILHFEQHHEKSEGITQYIRNKYEKYI